MLIMLLSDLLDRLWSSVDDPLATSAAKEEPPAWELPDSMLTGGMPANFEQTRRAVGDLTEQLAEKKDKIELLLERMAKLQKRYAAMTEEREDAERVLREAAKKEVKRRKRKSRKHRKQDKENGGVLVKKPSGKGDAMQKYAHPLDELKDFQENADHPCAGASPSKALVVADGNAKVKADGRVAHPLDDHFELGEEAEAEEEEARQEAELEEHVSRILDWVDKCRAPGEDPFEDMRREISANFDEIATTMHRIEGSSTQTFQPKGAETTLLEMLEARELALVEARDDLELLHEETDEAEYFWSNMYCADCRDDDVPEGDICSPEEAQLLLYLGKNLHDYMYNVEAHRDYLVDVSEKFDTGLF